MKSTSFEVKIFLLLILIFVWGCTPNSTTSIPVIPSSPLTVSPQRQLTPTLIDIPKVIPTQTPAEDWNNNAKLVMTTKDGSIVIFSQDGGRKQISPVKQECVSPVMSPSRKKLAFSCVDNSTITLYIYDFLGENLVPLTMVKFHKWDLVVEQWTSEEDLYVANTPSYWLTSLKQDNWASILSSTLYIIKIDESKSEKLADYSMPVIQFWQINNSNSFLLLSARFADNKTSYSFYLLDHTGKLQSFPVKSTPSTQASVSPDGKYLAYLATQPDSNDMEYIHIIDIYTKTETGQIKLTQKRFINDPLIWSNDSRFIAFEAANGLDIQFQTYVYDLASQQSENICNCFSLSWSANGNYLAYLAPVNDESQKVGPGLYIYSLKSGASKKINPSGLSWDFPIWIDNK